MIGISFTAVSSKPQAEEISLTNQRETNERNAIRIGVHIPPEHYLEVPGHTREYDTLFEIMEDVEAYRRLWEIISNRRAQVLLAYHPSRLARTESLLMDIARKCWRHGVALYLDSMPPQTLDPRRQRADMGQKMLLAFGGVQSGDDLEQLRERHRTGMLARVTRKGLDAGQLKYGYIYRMEGQRKVKAVDEAVAPIIREILLDLFVAQQLTYWDIAEILTQRGTPTPSQRRDQIYARSRQIIGDVWHYSQIRRLTANARHYAGYLDLNKASRVGRAYTGWVRADFPAIITEDEAAAVEAEIARRTRGPYRHRALSHICRCAHCGARLHATQASTGRDGKLFYYDYYYLRCKSCKINYRSDDVIAILREIFQHIATASDTDALALFSRAEDHRADEIQQQIQQAEAEIAATAAAVERLVDALADPSLPAAIIKGRLRKAQDDQRAAEDRAMSLALALAELRAQPAPEQQIADIRAAGLGILDRADEDPAGVNQWLSRHIQQIRIAEGTLVDVIFY